MRFQPKKSYTPPPVELSPNRQALLDLNAARVAAKAEVEALQARMNSLAKLRDAIAPI